MRQITDEMRKKIEAGKRIAKLRKDKQQPRPTAPIKPLQRPGK